MTGRWNKEPSILEGYREDESGLVGNPDALARPASEQDVVEIVKECRADRHALTPIGLQSSTTGSSVAFEGALLSTEKMDRLLDIDPFKMTATAQPGINLLAFKKEIAAAGLFYPPDPTSEPDCCLGGSVATNASGARTYLYGPTRNWIRRLKVVLGTGAPISVQAVRASKNTTGYFGFQNPVDPFIGSEGTLGIITEITVALLAAPEAYYGAMALFPTLESAIRFVLHADAEPALTPRCLELFDRASLDLIKPLAERFTIPPDAGAAIYFEVEVGKGEKAALSSLEIWLEHLESSHALAPDTIIALTIEQQEELRRLRHCIPETLNEKSRACRSAGGRKVSSDWAVPLNNVYEFVMQASEIVERTFGGEYYRYGHIGNGHPHFNLIARDDEELRRAETATHDICRRVVERAGAVTAEHGVGKLKRPFAAYQFPPPIFEAMKAVKRTFDPDMILAPGNIFPSAAERI
ncbi:MAG: FAD-binding oxidoreductase [Candidatus Eisenbacteria bacterium]|uniref:D-lactate dehydrogenase (cytochrome) n=1 Tax=Eiseniibacteriota bacterium TaxID=2212470 RepID=A0A948RSJ1_UNCEI|nr:FAD-binding oxidoreductase [Candidatus Eisenbacteria bacterium]MBU1948714.1 FAD-binding oxidoreductase [Candidatus Eisenbacteria bacterium]MBU2690213.1 FAD-binding oxidoreductase [Candidatus Eisenbacteria bacterium]